MGFRSRDIQTRFDIRRYVNVSFHCLLQSLRNMMTANTTDACETRDPCQHGGICISTDSGPFCECRSGDYEGAYCEKGRLFYIRKLRCLRPLLLPRVQSLVCGNDRTGRSSVRRVCRLSIFIFAERSFCVDPCNGYSVTLLDNYVSYG